EPVHGAGGVIPPTPGYWPRLRDICDRHDVLLIADEVITGFGRTGRWFALEHWDVRPDLVTFAKAVTSAYVPLSGVILSDRVHRTFLSLPPDLKFMHGYTNSAHPTACAVGLRNLDIMEREGLVQRAEAMGARLRSGLETLRGEEHVGDVRGLGLMCAVELVADRATRQPFDPALGLGPRIFRMMRERGLLTRMKGESILLAPPLVITEAEVDRIVDIVGSVVREVRTAVASRA
ncbi:MAG TPA: aminotransferase class III-fold pyridoxal phosphate-dependent enzyme, partial [Dehalococcoidia bacterium]|nr:aminotransferase class III-fold pyridoxal phosphate-dependent enzyme [Dehalococcoidia bacterium]